MENAFRPGDPVLDLAARGKQISIASMHEGEDDEQEHWIERAEQAHIDAIINGTYRGHYHLLVGEKGTGKSSMLIDAM